MLNRIREAVRADSHLAVGIGLWAFAQFLMALWDVPGAWSWENDAVAPRELFNAVITNLTPGRGHNYPLFHNLVLFLLALPFVLPVAFQPGAFDSAETIRYAVLDPAYMTPVLVVAKLLTIAMGVVMLFTIARITRRLFNDSAARWAVAFAVSNLSIGYYFRTTNLDGPYLMWTVLAFDRALDVIEKGRGRDYLAFGAFAALAVATKDQAYAGFVLMAPLVFVVVPAVRTSMLAAAAHHWLRLLKAFAASVVIYAAASGALLNPTGFVARLRLLTGTNSQDWRTYSPTWTGRWDNAVDAAFSQATFWWPWTLVALAWGGVVVAATMPSSALGTPPGSAPEPLKHRLWRMMPFMMALGAFVGFTLVVGRNEERFLLPPALWLSIYGGVMVSWASARGGRPLRWGLAGVVLGAGVWTLRLPMTQWNDARHAVVAYLRTQPGRTVETYGLTVYQPHFD
ncbi:MAG: glycosyltransferase family 39 protein, partial [Myxococcota bacterium]